MRSTTASALALWIAAAFSGHGAYAGRIDVDRTTLVAAEKSITVSAVLAIDEQVDIDLFNMPSFILPTGVGGADEVEVVYYKIEATQRTIAGGFLEVVWHGSISDSDRIGLATLIQKSDGNVAGIFSTETSAFMLSTMPEGTLELKETFWADDFDDSVVDDEVEPENYITGDAVEEETFSSAMVIDSLMSEASTTSWGNGAGVSGGESRSLRDGNRNLQSLTNVDVLILITNRAMCGAARLPAGCTLNARNRAPIEGMVKVVEEQTNTAMQAVGVRTAIRFVRTVHLSNGYDGRPSRESLQDMRNSEAVSSWRAGAGADLIAMVTGDDPSGTVGGISYLNLPWSASRYVVLLDGVSRESVSRFIFFFLFILHQPLCFADSYNAFQVRHDNALPYEILRKILTPCPISTILVLFNESRNLPLLWIKS